MNCLIDVSFRHFHAEKMISWSFLLLFAIRTSVSLTAIQEDPCHVATDISNLKRAPIYANTEDVVELCDSDLLEGKWYYLGGEITNSCVDLNRCSTFAGIWYNGSYPKGDEIVSGNVCAKIDRSSCCEWRGTINIKKCPMGYVYQLAIPKECPMSYCVGEPIPCPSETVFDRDTGTCIGIPQLQRPTLSRPYISNFKLHNASNYTNNATMFSIDCELKSSSVIPNAIGKLKVEVVFIINETEVGRSVLDFPTPKATLEETSLYGHIGKTLTCEAQLFYEFVDGSNSTKTSVVKSSGYFFGIEAIDDKDEVVKEIHLQQGVTKDIFLRSTFPITYGPCVKFDKCDLLKYSFAISVVTEKVKRHQCQIMFENPHGLLVYKSSIPIRISPLITPGIQHSRDLLAFSSFSHVYNGTIFQGYTISPIPVIVSEPQTRPTCHSVGDPHFLSFHGVSFDNYFSGDFNLLSAKNRTFQIQVRQIFCAGRISCNCGVMAREGNNLIGISACDYRKAPVVFQLMRDNVNPTASLQVINNEYQIKFVSGASLKVVLFPSGSELYMNIYVNGLKHEEYEGICAAVKQPADFNDYRISYSESFFKNQLPPCVNEVFKFVECECLNDTKHPNTVSTECKFAEPQKDASMVVFENICNFTSKVKRSADIRKKWRRSADEQEVFLAVESRTSIQGLTIDDIFSTVDHSRDNEEFREVELMSLNEAQGHCSRILETVQFSTKCREILGDKHEALQKNCIDDVKLSGNAMFAQTYLNVYEEVCITTLEKEVPIVDGELSPESKEIIDILREMNLKIKERQIEFTLPWFQKTTPTTVERPVTCPSETIFDQDTGDCIDFPELQAPILTKPYISKFIVLEKFNATMFSIDCEFNPSKNMVNAFGKLKLETVFKMNEEEIVRFETSITFPTTVVTLEETYLIGHIGKTIEVKSSENLIASFSNEVVPRTKLTCEAWLSYRFNDGSHSTRTSVSKSSGYYFGFEAVDVNGEVLKEIWLQQGVTKDIYLRSTFPITYGHCVTFGQCTLRKYSFVSSAMHIGVRRNDCQITFENPHGLLVYKSITPIRISSLVTPGTEQSRDFLAFAPFSHLFTRTIFQGFIISPIPVIVSEPQKGPTCHSVGDPHFLSFHGVFFDNYFSGDFNLLSAKNRTFQIQVRQISCVGRVSCNCGVMAREGNNLIGISICDYRKAPVVFQLMRDNVNPTASLEFVNNEYIITFVSGVSVKVSIYPFAAALYMNIYVNGLKHEEYEGICTALTNSADFNAYRISNSESFFKSQLPPCVNEVFKFPECECVNDTNQRNSVSTECRSAQPKQDAAMVVFENVCNLKELKRTALGQEVSLAVESRTSMQGLTIEDIFTTIDHSRDNESFQEVELMPVNEAELYCARILEKSQFNRRCKEFLGVKYDALLKNCIDDVKLSGTGEAAAMYLNIYEEVCRTMLAKEVELVDGKRSPESKGIVDALEEMNSAFTKRQHCTSTPGNEATKSGSGVISMIQGLLDKLKLSHVLVFSGTILLTGTAVFALS